MELKLGKTRRITPDATLTFNRTSMELKHLLHGFIADVIPPFNRTSMELKRHFIPLMNRNIAAFNRTSMELKRITSIVA